MNNNTIYTISFSLFSLLTGFTIYRSLTFFMPLQTQKQFFSPFALGFYFLLAIFLIILLVACIFSLSTRKSVTVQDKTWLFYLFPVALIAFTAETAFLGGIWADEFGQGGNLIPELITTSLAITFIIFVHFQNKNRTTLQNIFSR